MSVLTASLLALLLASPSQAQGDQTRTISLRSGANGDSYVLYVDVPSGYEAGSARYPVVYLLDGDWYFRMTVGIDRTLTAMQALRPAIIVGIGYGGDDVAAQRERRFKDMTPTNAQNRANSGHADKFLATLRDDILPAIDKQYRTNGERILIGHSLGGLFTAVAMVRQPALFQGYGVLSPSLWWDGSAVLKEEERFRKGGGVLRGRAYLAVGADENRDTMVAPFEQLTAIIDRGAYPELNVSHHLVQGATHVGSIPGSISMALQWLLQAPAAPARSR